MSEGRLSITINLLKRELHLFKGQQLYNTYPIAIGKPSTPSPVGKWTIVNKVIMDGLNVYGSRWMGLSKANYGIHGTNNPSSIGNAVSLGCIRMYNEDVEHIFQIVPLGTPVDIIPGGSGSGYPLPPYNPSSPNGSIGSGQGNSKIYVIKLGDTLWEIAQKNGLSLEDLVKANPGLNPDLIHPGEVIYLP